MFMSNQRKYIHEMEKQRGRKKQKKKKTKNGCQQSQGQLHRYYTHNKNIKHVGIENLNKPKFCFVLFKAHFYVLVSISFGAVLTGVCFVSWKMKIDLFLFFIIQNQLCKILRSTNMSQQFYSHAKNHGRRFLFYICMYDRYTTSR